MANIPVLTVELVEEKDLHADLDRRIRALLRACFPDWESIFQDRRTWHGTAPLFSIIAQDDSRIVGHIALVVRTITTTWNFRYNVISVQGVCVDPAHRHSGLAHQMIRMALDESARRGFPFAILYCKEPLVPFYANQGWKLADDSIVMWNQRDLPIAMRSNCPMYYELADTPLPDGPLDVHSPSW